MDNLWKSKFTKVSKNVTETPKDIVQEQCVALSELTNGKVIARISEYDGEVKSGSISHDLSKRYLNSISLINEFNVQDTLGEIENDEVFKYEFFITSVATPKYKFRAFFLYYGINIYPATLVIESGIAELIGVNQEISMNNKDEFISVLSKILNSDRLIEIISSLLNLN